jgi:two-component system cell cycle response regulator
MYMFAHHFEVGITGKSIFRRFVLLFLAIASIFTLIWYLLVQIYEDGRISELKAREQGYLNVSSWAIKNELIDSIEELRTLSETPVLEEYLDHTDRQTREKLITYLRLVSDINSRYIQIRLIDNRGHEVIRINNKDGRSILVPKEQLQDKSGRYYFSDAIKLEKGGVYISPLDLNIEHGQIETPYQPVIRFATPLFDSRGEKEGVFVINYDGKRLLEAFRSHVQDTPQHQGILINRDGYWLSGMEHEKEWGFMFGREDLTFERDFPDIWPAISSGDKGMLQTEKGLFVFATVSPLQDYSLSSDKIVAPVVTHRENEYKWKIVLFTPAESLMAESFLYQPFGRIILGFIYLLIALCSILISYASLKRKQFRIKEKEDARRIEDLYNLAPCGYHSLDVNGMVVRMNQTELDWLGYQRDEVLGKMHYIDLLTEKSSELYKTCFPGFLAAGYINDVQLQLLRKDGSQLPVMISATSVKDQDGRFVMTRSTVFDMSERKKFEEELEQQARVDFLTGIRNRRSFYESGESEIHRSRRFNKPLGLILVDLDHFKEINDNYGHDAGDAVLKALSNCFHTLRDVDIPARLGGDEFAVLLPETDCQTVADVAERLRQFISSTSVHVDGDKHVSFFVSMGIACLVESDTSIEDMIKRADIGLYGAKAAGRNQLKLEKA